MRSARHRTQDGQTLSRHLHTVPAKQVRWIQQGFLGHDYTMRPKLDRVKIRTQVASPLQEVAGSKITSKRAQSEKDAEILTLRHDVASCSGDV